MRLASFNVENLFDRARALNTGSPDEGRAALAAFRELNELFAKVSYSAADRKRMLKLLTEQGLDRTDDGGKFLILRKIRGQLIARPKGKPPEIVATGRAGWVGWVELLDEAVSEIATGNTGRVISAVDADILALVEVENRTTLKRFESAIVQPLGTTTYRHVMLVDGNDPRGIDVAIMTKTDFPIVSIRSHVDDRDDKSLIFSRDCAEYEIALPGGGRLWVLVNHLKSKGYGAQVDNDARRLRQAERVRAIVDAHFAAGDEFVSVVGDFNDSPASAPLVPLLGASSGLRDVSVAAAFDDGGRPGTYGTCTAANKFDYILCSPKLFAAIRAGGYERRGMWGGVNGTLWPHFPQVAGPDDAASDHAAVWAEFDL